jgi:hypothetical protein
MKLKKGGVFLIPLLAFCFVFFALPPAVESAQEENHCFICHTSARDLIKITREIEAAKPKPKASAESEGEG